jgi:hypothetical protein
MATLTNQQINLTYPGLIKLDDNAQVDPLVLKQLSDGVGGSLPISISQIETKFQVGSVVDFTGVTVNGISSGGLIAGNGPDSMVSAPFLSPNPASATGSNGFAFGNIATAGGGLTNIAIGNGVTAGDGVDNYAIAIGHNTSAGDGTVAMGANTGSTSADSAVIIGNSASGVTRSISLGRLANGSGSNSVSIGNESDATAADAVALGNGVQATKAQTTTVRKLETLDPGEGVIMHSPNGTEFKVTVSDAGAIVVTAV